MDIPIAMGHAHRAPGHTIRKTTIELDFTELETAKETLGTATARETVNTALREVNRRAALAGAASGPGH